MFGIGDFARHGRVSIRMLRHYDATGLLRPAHVDPATGYRHYTAGQLSRLNRIIALKDLGFTLQQVGEIIGGAVSTEELRGLLRLRQAELAETMAAAASRLAQVEARLRAIEDEGRALTDEVTIKSVPAVRVAELTAVAPGYDPSQIGPVIQPLYRSLFERLATAGITHHGYGIADYSEAPDGILVHAGVEVDAPLQDSAEVTVNASLRGSAGVTLQECGVHVRDLPPLPQAATIVHHGSMDAVLSTVQSLARWIDAHGYSWSGFTREVTLECPADPADWVTELQAPLTA